MGYLTSIDSGFLATPQYTNAIQYYEHFDSLSELQNVLTLDTQTNIWYKKINVTYKGQTGLVPIACRVIGDDDIGYDAQAMGLYSQAMANGLLYDISLGLGAKWDTYSDDWESSLQDFISEFGDIPGVILNDTRYVIDNIVEWVNNYLTNKYGDIPPEVKYYYNVKEYPDGQNVIVNWDNSKIADVVGAIAYNHDSIGLSYETLRNDLQEYVDSNDADVMRVLSKCAMRFGRHTVGNTKDFFIYGYDISNNDIVTTSQGNKKQYHTGLVTHYYTLQFDYTSGHLVKTNSFDGNVGSLETFYNYPRYGRNEGGGFLYARLTNGLQNTTEAQTEFDYIMDTIGVTGNIKPYETLPTGGVWTKQPDNTYKVGYPDDDNPDDNTPVRNGNPVPPNIVIIPHNIIGVIPLPGKDTYRVVPWDNDPPDDATDGLYNVFAVNSGILKQLNAKLWTTSVIEEVKRAFTNNPLDAIISLHEVYYSPELMETEGGFTTSNIFLGAYDTDISAYPIPKRYQKIEFNPIPINKQFENVRDYQRDVVIYLPFIGFRQLDITDICGCTANSSIYIEYNVDNITGDCVATIFVNKDGNIDRKPLYMFNGNCSSELPMTGADRSGLLSASLSAVGGIASTVLTGGATAPSLIGSAIGIANNMGMSLERSGNITGNHGAMSIKNPFIIINYPIPFDADNFKKYGGQSSNVTTTLKYCSGFTQMSECIIDNIPCTSNESDSIRSLLASGVIV